MKSKVLNLNLIPALLGILVISSMLIMGQASCPPQTAISQITDIWPPEAKSGESVTISGMNFGTSQDTSIVTFDGIDAGQATSWSGTTITLNVPEGYASGDVVVTVDSQSSSGFPFAMMVDQCQLDADCDDDDSVTKDACNNGRCENEIPAGEEDIDPRVETEVFGGRYEAGGEQGIHERYDAGWIIGAKGQAQAYSSISPSQVKTMSMGVGVEWQGKQRTDVEAGWIWNGADSKAPMLYVASYENGGRKIYKLLDWFNPGAVATFRIWHEVVSGRYTGRWMVYAYAPGARRSYTIPLYNYAMGPAPSFGRASGLDMSVWGERNDAISNRGEFRDLMVYIHAAYGPTSRGWKYPATLYDFTWWDSDPSFKMMKWRAYGLNYGMCIRGNGETTCP